MLMYEVGKSIKAKEHSSNKTAAKEQNNNLVLCCLIANTGKNCFVVVVVS
jgi:hypothetical protein